MDRIHVMELAHAYRFGKITRRDFLRRSGAALGSMAAANLLLAACAATPDTAPSAPVVQGTQPVEPEQTTADGLVTSSIEYPGEGETLTGYLAHPGEGTHPAVVVIQEWWGLNEHIKDVTRRFAREGFVALAPDLYHGAVASEPDEARKLVMELDMAAAVEEIRQAIAFLQAQPSVGSQKVGVVGFCMGGGLALQTALAEKGLGAAVAFYGRPLAEGQATQVKAPILGLYGAQDSGIPASQVQAMEAALDSAGVPNEFHIYEGAGHAFFNDTSSNYVPDAATDAWSRTLAWFHTNLEG